MSTIVEEILQFNQHFVTQTEYSSFSCEKYPRKKLAILTCMDTRLTKLLPAALNLENGDAKIIKNAGAVITNPFGSVMLSLLIAVYQLEVDNILVITHHDCGMQGLNSEELIEKMKQRHVKPELLNLVEFCGIDLHEWFSGICDPHESVRHTVEIIRKHPLLPGDVRVSGMVIHPGTGKLDPVIL